MAEGGLSYIWVIRQDYNQEEEGRGEQLGEVTDTSKSQQQAVGNRVAWGLAESWTWSA